MLEKNSNDKLVEELTAIIKEFGKPAKIVHSVRDSKVDDDDFLRQFLDLLSGDDEKPEAKKQPEASVEEEASVEDNVVEDDFETFVGGLVVDAVEVEDDGERMYFCSVDDDAFYMPKAVFDKYFVKI